MKTKTKIFTRDGSEEVSLSWAQIKDTAGVYRFADKEYDTSRVIIITAGSLPPQRLLVLTVSEYVEPLSDIAWSMERFYKAADGVNVSFEN